MNPEITQADKQAAFNRALKHQPLCYPEACDELLAECEMWKRKCGEKNAETSEPMDKREEIELLPRRQAALEEVKIVQSGIGECPIGEVRTIGASWAYNALQHIRSEHKAALDANREKDAELDRVKDELFTQQDIDEAYENGRKTAESSLRASGESWVEITPEMTLTDQMEVGRWMGKKWVISRLESDSPCWAMIAPNNFYTHYRLLAPPTDKEPQ